jgi:predicted N-acetyltransferase YhbS
MIAIREARESDVPAIRDIFVAVYGSDYCYPEFYDEQFLKKMVFADDTLVLVAEDPTLGGVVGTGSVLLETGAHSDLVAEFGRLAVHPEAQGYGIGSRIMQARIEQVQDRLHVGFVEGRVAHFYSSQNAEHYGFAAVGFLPLKLRLGERESLTYQAKYFGDALDLRKNHPRVIPEVYPLACIAMDHLGLRGHPIIDEHSVAYPGAEDDFMLETLTTRGYAPLLRLERGRVERREIFGPMRLHYGFFRIQASHSTYLVARERGRIVGAIGYTVDECENTARIFELISLDDRPVRFLVTAFLDWCHVDKGVHYVEIDVSAYAPRMQRTFVELGFIPAAYVPALAFHRSERLDVVKMISLFVPPGDETLALIPSMQRIQDVVMRSWASRTVAPKIGAAIHRATLFQGLTDDQAGRVARVGTFAVFHPGDRIYGEGEPADALFVVLEGEIAIAMGPASTRVGTVSPGECLGEISLLLGGLHTASAVATSPVEVGVFRHAELLDLVRRRPDIGVVLYRNLGRGLGRKLTRSDDSLIRE